MIFLRGRLRPPLALAAAGVAAVMIAPVAVILLKANQAGSPVWTRLWQTRIIELCWNSTRLILGVSALTLLWGTSAAWIMARYSFFGRSVWRWLLASPLAVPPYILAFVYTDLWGPSGPLRNIWSFVFGEGHSWHYLYGSYPATVWVLSLATYPYVFLLSRVAFSNLNSSYEESARLLGVTKSQAFWRVTLPMVRPAIAAGLFVVMLYCLSDFGAVSILRFSTFTRIIYLEMRQRLDLAAVSAISSILFLICFAILFLERRSRKRAAFFQTRGSSRPAPLKPMGTVGTVCVWLYFGLLCGCSTILVVLRLLAVSFRLLLEGGMDHVVWGAALNSLGMAFAAATLATAGAFWVVYFAFRFKHWISRMFLRLSYAGFILPGPVVAVAIIAFFLDVSPLRLTYGSVAVLGLAYVIRFLPLALQGLETSFSQLTPQIPEAARMCGFRGWRLFWRITYPLIKPGLLTAWVFVFLNAMRELPATLMLRPVGFETLAVRVWMETNNEFFTLASPAALVLVLLSLPLTAFLLTRQFRFRGYMR